MASRSLGRSRLVEHIAHGRYAGGRFWAGFGGFWAVLEAESALALAPERFGGRNVKMGKALSGAFFDFFRVFGGIGPELALFNPLFVPYACRCDDAFACTFRPFPSALLHASVGPRLPKWQGRCTGSINSRDEEYEPPLPARPRRPRQAGSGRTSSLRPGLPRGPGAGAPPLLSRSPPLRVKESSPGRLSR